MADGGTWTGERGKINWLQWDSMAPFVWIPQSSTYTAVWILAVLFTPLPDASRCLGNMCQGSLEMWFFSFFHSLSLFFSFKFVDMFDRSVGSVERFSGSSLWINVKMPASQCSEDWKVWIWCREALYKKKKLRWLFPEIESDQLSATSNTIIHLLIWQPQNQDKRRWQRK